MYVYCVRLKILYRKNFKDVQASNKKFITNNWKNIILHIFAYKDILKTPMDFVTEVSQKSEILLAAAVF